MSAAVAPGSANGVAHSTVMSSEPFAMMTGAGLETWMVADEALFGAVFGSAVAEVTFADAAIDDPLAAAQSASVTVRVKVAEAPTASDGVVHWIGPLPPAPGAAQVQPAGAVSDWKTVWPGTVVASDTFAAGRSSFVGLNDAVSVS